MNCVSDSMDIASHLSMDIASYITGSNHEYVRVIYK